MRDDEYRSAVDALFAVVSRRPGPELHSYLAHLEWALSDSPKARRHLRELAEAFECSVAHARRQLRSERDEMRSILRQPAEVGHA